MGLINLGHINVNSAETISQQMTSAHYFASEVNLLETKYLGLQLSTRKFWLKKKGVRYNFLKLALRFVTRATRKIEILVILPSHYSHQPSKLMH